MKIKLIAPARKPEWGESFWDLKTLCKLTGRKAGGAPLALPTLASLTPSDAEVVLTDENIESIDFEEKVDLVGITGMTCVIPRSYEIADEYRKRGVPVVMGGIHVSMLPEEAIQHSDSVVIGEAEEIWKQVVSDAQKKKLEKFYRAPRFPDLTNAPIPRWDLLKFTSYPIFPIQTGRGCPYDCDFCSVKVFNGRQYRHKKINRVLEEIDILRNLERKKTFFFVDDNILALRNYAREFFYKLPPYKVKWWAQASVSGLEDEEMLDLMYQAGCREIFIGFESVSQKSLDSMGKSKINRVEEYKRIIDKVHSHGIAVFASFIFASDNDDKDIFETTSRFINENNIAFSMINILTPSPGTSLYQTLEKEHRLILKEWWRFNGEYVCFKTKMAKEYIYRNRDALLNSIYSYDNIFRRLYKLWDQGVLVRDKRIRKLFTKGRIIFTLKIIFNITIPKKIKIMILKSLWQHKEVSIMPVLFALNFYDYAYNLNTRKQ